MRFISVITILLLLHSCSRDNTIQNNNNQVQPVGMTPFQFNGNSKFTYAYITGNDTTTKQDFHYINTQVLNGDSVVRVYYSLYSDTLVFVWNQNSISLKADPDIMPLVTNGAINCTYNDTMFYSPSSTWYVHQQPLGTQWTNTYIRYDPWLCRIDTTHTDMIVVGYDSIETVAGKFYTTESQMVIDTNYREYHTSFGMVKAEYMDPNQVASSIQELIKIE